jgi:hypothetical protein
MPMQSKIKEHLPEILCSLFGILVMYWQWFAINPDGISYTDIGMKWGSAHYKEAVNAYWSPLWSWLLIPVMRVIGHPHVSIRLLQFILLLIGLRCWKKWVNNIIHQENKSGALMRFIGGINLAYYSQAISGPDFLACILVIEFSRKLIFQKPSFLILGFWLALFYYTKIYLLYWGLGAVVITHVYRTFFNKEKIFTLKTILKLFASICIAAILISPWVKALQQKYNKWMLGSSKHYNSVYLFAGGIEQCWKEFGLLEPPDAFSTFVWTDITRRTDDFRPLIQQKNKSFTAIFSYNLLKTFRLLAINACAGFIALYFLGRLRKDFSKDQKDRILLSLALAVLYMGGYLLFSSEHRYLWPAFMVLTSLAVCLPIQLFPVKNRSLHAIILCCITLPHSIIRSFDERHGIKEHKLACSVQSLIPKGAHIASWRTGQTWFISYYNRYHDYGGIQREQNFKLAENLEKNDIRYILVPHEDLQNAEHMLYNIKFVKTPVQAGSWYVLKMN